MVGPNLSTLLGHNFLVVFIERTELEGPAGCVSWKAGVEERKGTEVLRGREDAGRFVCTPERAHEGYF